MTILVCHRAITVLFYPVSYSIVCRSESTDSAKSIAVDPDFVPPMSRAAMKHKKRKSKKHRKDPRKSEGLVLTFYRLQWLGWS